VPATCQPHAVLVDSRLEVPLGARLFQPGRRLFIYTATGDPSRQAALESQGATVIALPGPGGKVDLAALLRDLASREINEVHVEAGHKLNGSLVREGLVDEFLVYLAPQLLGAGRGMAAIGPFLALEEAIPLEFHDVQRVGMDLRVIARTRTLRK
jgi:diaminohydroxyphosphoribosylaminopyrimidine deaminase/5-amino-6-(5-phosphoribosylamino)uracil reductase